MNAVALFNGAEMSCKINYNLFYAPHGNYYIVYVSHSFRFYRAVNISYSAKIKYNLGCMNHVSVL